MTEHAPDQIVDPLIAFLGEAENDNVFRAMAARALGDMGDNFAVDPLIEAFNDPDPLVRSNAAHSLARLDSQRALEVLVQVFEGPDKASHQIVATTLAVEGGEQAKETLKAMIEAGEIPDDTIPQDAMDLLDEKNTVEADTPKPSADN